MNLSDGKESMAMNDKEFCMDENLLYIDDITGVLGEWLAMDTSELPAIVVSMIGDLYKECIGHL